MIAGNLIFDVDAPSGAFDQALADALMQLARRDEPWLRGVLVYLSKAVQQGDACIELGTAWQCASQTMDNSADLYAALMATNLVGEPGASTPLICDGERLYLRRYFEYESQVAEDLRRRAAMRNSIVALPSLQAALDTLFPPLDPALDWQRIAALLALRSCLTVICGGPGTGKTWAVLRLLVLLQQQSALPLRMAMAAPTGKAAAHLSENIQRGLSALPIDDGIRALIPQSAITVHRLLGTRPFSTHARHHRNAPLPLDVLVVDEASMVDLPTMARLLAALPETARLILIGDPDQLAAVETGSVLAELRSCNPLNKFSPALIQELSACGCNGLQRNESALPIGDSIVTLNRSRRHSSDSGIAGLLNALRTGASDTALELLDKGAGISRIESSGDRSSFDDGLVQYGRPNYAPLQRASDPAAALAALRHFRILCALREGPRGTRALNRMLARACVELPSPRSLPALFHLAPVLITENDYALDLHNGDTGVAWRGRDAEVLRVWFDDRVGELRGFAAHQLAAYELCYAMTVHKAQGSEFEHVALVLPEAPHPLLSRQWLYTACSRARSQLTVFGNAAVVRAALERDVRRSSGLAAMLRKPLTGDMVGF